MSSSSLASSTTLPRQTTILPDGSYHLSLSHQKELLQDIADAKESLLQRLDVAFLDVGDAMSSADLQERAFVESVPLRFDGIRYTRLDTLSKIEQLEEQIRSGIIRVCCDECTKVIAPDRAVWLAEKSPQIQICISCARNVSRSLVNDALGSKLADLYHETVTHDYDNLRTLRDELERGHMT